MLLSTTELSPTQRKLEVNWMHSPPDQVQSPSHQEAPRPWGHSEQDAAVWFPQLTGRVQIISFADNTQSPLQEPAEPVKQSEQEAAVYWPQLTVPVFSLSLPPTQNTPPTAWRLMASSTVWMLEVLLGCAKMPPPFSQKLLANFHGFSWLNAFRHVDEFAE